ncbi:MULTISPECIES: cache domain-containing protein [unclassified Nocardioides]|uniref:cache domain-containing protein n=1 Tax=unclassified Nocardioides TaxID=2615069 RepID=UPI003619F3A2
MSTSTLSDPVARCATAVTAYFDALFGSLDGIGGQVAAVGSPMSASALDDLVEPLATLALARHPVVGAGFVATPGWLTDRDLHLAWWQGEERQPLAERGVPIGHHVFDYSRHEWFRTPQLTGARHVTGPYVDYVCTDEYVLTATVPVLVDDRMVGVAGADTRLETFEQLMREPLTGAGSVVLVNTHDRCVVAADPLLRSGQKVDVAAYATARALTGLPFRVLGGA